MSEFYGKVYIICFDQPIQTERANVKHYVGFATHLEQRIQHHRNGTGAAILRAANNAGIKWNISRVFKNATREIERKIKNYKKTAAFCPNCFSDVSKTLSTPKGYTEAANQWKRAYKLITAKCGTIHVERITVSQVELLKRLATRFKIGESFQIENKLYTRQNRRQFGSAFQIQEMDFSIPETPDENEKLKTKLNLIQPNAAPPACVQCGEFRSLDESGICWLCVPAKDENAPAKIPDPVVVFGGFREMIVQPQTETDEFDDIPF